jgi:hypothetical protein
MEPFAYVAALTSIVLGLGIARVLSGLGVLLQRRGERSIYWVHALWGINVLLFLLMNWWILYRWHSQEVWTFFLFVFILISPIVSFLLTVILFPEPLYSTIDLKQHYYENCRWFFALAAILPLIDFADTLLKGWSHFLAQGIIYPITILLIFVLSVIAAITKRERYHAFFAVFFLLYLTVFIGINLLTLV